MGTLCGTQNHGSKRCIVASSPVCAEPVVLLQVI